MFWSVKVRLVDLMDVSRWCRSNLRFHIPFMSIGFRQSPFRTPQLGQAIACDCHSMCGTDPLKKLRKDDILSENGMPAKIRCDMGPPEKSQYISQKTRSPK